MSYLAGLAVMIAVLAIDFLANRREDKAFAEWERIRGAPRGKKGFALLQNVCERHSLFVSMDVKERRRDWESEV